MIAPPRHVIGIDCFSNVNEYFAEMGEDALTYAFFSHCSSKPYNKIRLMILGSPGVGKTAFVNALIRSEGQKAGKVISETLSYLLLNK